MNIIAGEPVPPGFEDEVNTVPEIQQAIDQYKGNALLGLEYTLELHEDDRREPGYFCVLCDKRGDPRTIMQHWTSFNHRLRYLQKHYPSAVREFNPAKYKPNSHNILINIVQSLAEAIEDHHGRLALGVCSGDEFRRMKSKIISEVNAKYHYDERNGPNFLNVIDRSLWETKPTAPKMEQTLQITIKAPKRLMSEEKSTDAQSNRDDLDEISSDSDGQGSSKKSKKKREQSPAFRVLPRVRRSPPFEEERNGKENEKKLPTPKELSLQASHIAQEKYKWEKYRCMLEIQLKQMEKIQQDYEKNPEKHPLYPDEWKKFWNRRYKELQAEKKSDPNKYDYKPEWIIFWTKRMKDLFNVEVEKKKKEIKIKLGLPPDAEEKVEQLKEKYKVQVVRNASAVNTKLLTNERSKDSPVRPFVRERERDKNAVDVIDISDEESPVQHRSRSRSRSHSHSHSRSRSRRSRSISRGPKRLHARSSSLSKSPLSDDYDQRSHHHHHHHRPQVTLSTRGYPSIEADYYAAAGYSRSRFVGMPPAHYGAPPPHYRVLESHQYPKYERSPSPNSRSTSVKEEPEPEDDGPLTVVAVLRLLTALEEHLGSLGPKVVDLLGKALALEKVKANSADDLLLNDDHCVFFETIKEKLKGLLIADMLDDQQKVRAIKRAIKNIAAVVHQVSTRGSKSDKQDNDTAGTKDEKAAQKSGTVASVKDLPFDRQVVATRLAAALVLQGREDVSTEDMDKLIFMFILMVKLSKAKSEIDGKPILTKDILPELGISVPKPAMDALAALPALVDELFENEMSAMVHEAVEEASNDTSEKDSKADASSSMLESLTDSDLQTLLQNFKHLSTEEQHHLIAHLKKLETADPARVEKLRKFVNLNDLAEVASTSASSASALSARRKESSNLHSTRYDNSPVPGTQKELKKYSDDDTAERRRGVNVSNPNKFSLDDEDEDDDYNVEDVFKAAISKVGDNARQTKSDAKSTDSSTQKGQPISTIEPIVPVSSSPNALTFNPAGLNISLSDTQNLIANLMGSLQQSNASQNASGSKPAQTTMSQSSVTHTQPISVTSQQAHQQQQQSVMQTSTPYYQQGQHHHQGYGNGYNQMAGMTDQTQAYYNTMGGYNNAAAVGYPGYQQWGGGGTQNMQQYGMPNFVPPQQQQQHMGYNMYGHGPN